MMVRLPWPRSSPSRSTCAAAARRRAKRYARAKARRWVVERTHSWLNRLRGILIRWAKKPANYLALLHSDALPG